MKSSILGIAVSLGLCAALGPLSLKAQTSGTIHAHIPFGFTVGSQSFAAGEYEVRQVTTGVLAIQGADRRSSIMTMTTHADPNATPGHTRLTFNQYGDRYFLSQVSDSDRGWQLPASAVEKELIAQSRAAKPVVLVAGK
jgi:hypothetical protein